MTEKNISDKVLVANMKKAANDLADLMTEAKTRNIQMTFNISEVFLADAAPKFQAIIDIKRIEQL